MTGTSTLSKWVLGNYLSLDLSSSTGFLSVFWRWHQGQFAPIAY